MLNNLCTDIVGSKLTIAVIEIALQGPRKLTGIRRYLFPSGTRNMDR
jgi:hypothetical protein